MGTEDPKTDSGLTHCRIKALISHLPASEKEYLSCAGVTILSWGCSSSGEVKELARAFPQAIVSGLDRSAAISGRFDAIVTLHALAGFEFPLAVIQDHLKSCNSLYIAVVPHNEYPLAPAHRAQFRVESFPVRINRFGRLHAQVLGDALLVIYRSEQYRIEAPGQPDRAALDRTSDPCAETAAASESMRLAELEKWQTRFSLERRRFAECCREFNAHFQKQLALYRSQRAWRVMLGVRKAYTLLARRQWPWKAGLDEFELPFPQILNFIPDDLRQLVTNGPDSAVRSESKIPASGKYDVVILPIIDFEARFQRPQQMAVQFARAGHRVFWISPSRFLALSLNEPYRRVPMRENLWEIQPRGAPFELYGGALEPPAAKTLTDSISHVFEDLALTTTCVIAQFPSWRQVALGLRERFGARVIYDCMDDWPSWESEPLPGAFSLAEEVRLVAECDILVVTARELREKFAQRGVTSELIPNAADFDFFSRPPADLPLIGFPEPVIGFYGAIAEWFDVDLMAEVARSRPQYSFVLIGPVLDNVRRLEDLPNVRFLGQKPYSELPGYLRQFAVCVLPFRMNRLIQSVDPVKVYEYLSQGKPVVSTPLPELSALTPELLYFAGSPREFASQIDRALGERDDSLRRKRIAFASQNTWSSRVEALNRAVAASFSLISILVVTRNSREFIGPCLEAIRQYTAYPSYEIIVVDNDSTDGAADELIRRASAEPKIRMACLDRDHGIAGAARIAAGMAKGDKRVFLTPETLVSPGWLERLMRRLESDPSIGAVTAAPNRAAPPCCCLLSRKVWDHAGEYDRDFCLRIERAGYRVVAVEDSGIRTQGNSQDHRIEVPESLRQEEGAGGF